MFEVLKIAFIENPQLRFTRLVVRGYRSRHRDKCRKHSASRQDNVSMNKQYLATFEAQFIKKLKK